MQYIAEFILNNIDINEILHHSVIQNSVEMDMGLNYMCQDPKFHYQPSSNQVSGLIPKKLLHLIMLILEFLKNKCESMKLSEFFL